MSGLDTGALVRQLLAHGARYPDALGSAILARGAEAVGPLLSLLQDESLDYTSSPGGGYAPVHAAALLAKLKALEAIRPMLARLMRSEAGAVLADALLYALEELGPDVAPQALEALAGAREQEARFLLLSVLARCGVRDARIYTALLQQLQEEPAAGARSLARYGDSRAVEPLGQALDACPLSEDGEDLFANQALIELEAALDRLGGRLDAAQQEKVARAIRSRERLGLMFQGLLDALAAGTSHRGQRGLGRGAVDAERKMTAPSPERGRKGRKMSDEQGWSATEGGSTLGLEGAEGGTLVRDESHPAGPRLTLEEDPARSFHALTCTVPGWLVHRRFFGGEAEALAAWEEMKPALVELALQLPVGGAKGLSPETREAGAKLGAFLARFP